MIRLDKLKYYDGLQYVPAGDDKKPYLSEWQVTKRDYDFSDKRAKIIGLVCGEISGGIEAIDIDCKYDLTNGTLIKEYVALINQMDLSIMPLLVVQKTKNNGYHFVYKTDVVETSQKLAQRVATEEEQAVGDKIKVLIETRGTRSYIACFPSEGYEFKQGDFSKINKITNQQRETLFSAAYSFDTVPKKEFKAPIITQKKNIKGLKPSEDYNERGDVISLLEKHDWTVVGKRGSKILVRRPGTTQADSSGNYDEEKKWFSVFSTSTVFEAQTPYQPWAVFAVLECDGDFSLAVKKLSEMGYGYIDEVTRDNEISSVIAVDDDDYSFFATPSDYEDYLSRWRNGTFEMGKSTGIPELDKYFLFKEGNLVIINGIDNVGKSSVVWYLAMLSALLHGWKWMIFSSENRVGGVIRKLIEFYWCEPIDQMTELRYQIAKKFVEDHFKIIKCMDKLYNYKDILNIANKGLKREIFKGLMIDPYNSLKVDIGAKSKQQEYGYHYEAASVIQLFAKQNNLSIYLNCHVGSVGARNKDKEGFTRPPQKEDTEGGVMFANKADEFITIHRVTQHETEWMYTEFHVRKVKETETGGKVTFFSSPVDFNMVNDNSGFECVTSRGPYVRGYNPILNFHERNSIDTNKTIEPVKNETEFVITPNYDYELKPEIKEGKIPW